MTEPATTETRARDDAEAAEEGAAREPANATTTREPATTDRPLSTADIASGRREPAGMGTPPPIGAANTTNAAAATTGPAATTEPTTTRATNAMPAPATATKGTIAAGAQNGDAALFDEHTAEQLRSRWQALQVEFVDEPRGAVEKADSLVAEVMQQLAESFARERTDLEQAWSGGSEASTEDLRQAIRRYRSFFNRLLSL